MPYIPARLRSNARVCPATGGELCYAITQLCHDYLQREPESYASFGLVRHALASAWDVHFLPKLLEYEAKKRADNGDVE